MCLISAPVSQFQMNEIHTYRSEKTQNIVVQIDIVHLLLNIHDTIPISGDFTAIILL